MEEGEEIMFQDLGKMRMEKKAWILDGIHGIGNSFQLHVFFVSLKLISSSCQGHMYPAEFHFHFVPCYVLEDHHQ